MKFLAVHLTTRETSSSQVVSDYSRFSRDVTVAMLVYKTIAKKVFWEFDSIILQNLSDILPLFCTPTWPSQHVSENQELKKKRKIKGFVKRKCSHF